MVKLQVFMGLNPLQMIAQGSFPDIHMDVDDIEPAYDFLLRFKPALHILNPLGMVSGPMLMMLMQHAIVTGIHRLPLPLNLGFLNFARASLPGCRKGDPGSSMDRHCPGSRPSSVQEPIR